MGNRRYSDSDSAHILEKTLGQVLSTLQRVQAHFPLPLLTRTFPTSHIWECSVD